MSEKQWADFIEHQKHLCNRLLLSHLSNLGKKCQTIRLKSVKLRNSVIYIPLHTQNRMQWNFRLWMAHKPIESLNRYFSIPTRYGIRMLTVSWLFLRVSFFFNNSNCEKDVHQFYHTLFVYFALGKYIHLANRSSLKWLQFIFCDFFYQAEVKKFLIELLDWINILCLY